MRRSPLASVRMLAMSDSSSEWYQDSTLPVPLRHRVMWSPITALLCFAGMIAADIALGITVPRVLGLGIGVLWVVLAVHNRRTDNAFLRDLYAPADGAPHDVTNPG